MTEEYQATPRKCKVVPSPSLRSQRRKSRVESSESSKPSPSLATRPTEVPHGVIDLDDDSCEIPQAKQKAFQHTSIEKEVELPPVIDTVIDLVDDEPDTSPSSPERSNQNKVTGNTAEMEQSAFDACEESFLPLLQRCMAAVVSNHTAKVHECVVEIKNRIVDMTPPFIEAYSLLKLLRMTKNFDSALYQLAKRAAREQLREKRSLVPDGFKPIKKRSRPSSQTISHSEDHTASSCRAHNIIMPKPTSALRSHLENASAVELDASRILELVPKAYSDFWNQIGFIRHKQFVRPVLVLSPLHANASIRKDWVRMLLDSNYDPYWQICLAFGRKNNRTAITYQAWPKDIMPFEEGFNRGFDEIPRAIKQKLMAQTPLLCDEQDIKSAFEAMQIIVTQSVEERSIYCKQVELQF